MQYGEGGKKQILSAAAPPLGADTCRFAQELLCPAFERATAGESKQTRNFAHLHAPSPSGEAKSLREQVLILSGGAG